MYGVDSDDIVREYFHHEQYTLSPLEILLAEEYEARQLPEFAAAVRGGRKYERLRDLVDFRTTTNRRPYYIWLLRNRSSAGTLSLCTKIRKSSAPLPWPATATIPT